MKLNTYKMPGRNDPCPCDSGKKFKKCCITVAKQRMKDLAEDMPDGAQVALIVAAKCTYCDNKVQSDEIVDDLQGGEPDLKPYLIGLGKKLDSGGWANVADASGALGFGTACPACRVGKTVVSPPGGPVLFDDVITEIHPRSKGAMLGLSELVGNE